MNINTIRIGCAFCALFTMILFILSIVFMPDNYGWIKWLLAIITVVIMSFATFTDKIGNQELRESYQKLSQEKIDL